MMPRALVPIAASLLLLCLPACVVVFGKDSSGISDESGWHVVDEAVDGSEAAPAPAGDSTDAAPHRRVLGSGPTIGPFSDAIASQGFLFVSGQIAIDPVNGEAVRGDIRRSTRLVLHRIGTILAEEGLSLSHVVKATVFLKSMDDYAAMNEAYREAFPTDPPARSCVAVAGIARDADVEIEVIAARGAPVDRD